MTRCDVGSLAISMVVFGCASPANNPSNPEARVFYFDRNGDQRVDLEKHQFAGFADADWELRDDDFDGRYEKRVQYGFAVREKSVDLPVPRAVKIEGDNQRPTIWLRRLREAEVKSKSFNQDEGSGHSV